MPGPITRRAILSAGLGLGATAGLGPARLSAATEASRFEGIARGHLWLRHASLGEETHVAFRRRDGQLDEAGHSRLCWAFRDWRDGDAAIWMDPRLFDLLSAMQTHATIRADFPVRITLTSGYRTARRNRGIEGAAFHSQHIRGRAADISLTGLSHAATARLAEIMRAHGIGRYAGFTHVDVGPPGRRW